VALGQAWHVFLVVVLLVFVLIIQTLYDFLLFAALSAMVTLMAPLALTVADVHVFEDLVHLNIQLSKFVAPRDHATSKKTLFAWTVELVNPVLVFFDNSLIQPTPVQLHGRVTVITSLMVLSL
jgi:hypothetical protein